MRHIFTGGAWLVLRLLPLWLLAVGRLPQMLRLVILVLLTAQICLAAGPARRFWLWVSVASGAGLLVWAAAGLCPDTEIWLPVTAALAVLRITMKAENRIARCCARNKRIENSFIKNGKKR